MISETIIPLLSIWRVLVTQHWPNVPHSKVISFLSDRNTSTATIEHELGAVNQ